MQDKQLDYISDEENQEDNFIKTMQNMAINDSEEEKEKDEEGEEEEKDEKQKIK